MRAPAVGLALALCWAPLLAETIELRGVDEPIRGRVLVEFAEVLFVAVDGAPHRFVARADVMRIIDQGGVAWVKPAPGAFARLLPGAPRGALTDTTLEVRVVQRGHRMLAGKRGPLFLFDGDRAECEGAARLTLVDGTALNLGAESSLRVGERLVLTAGEARVSAGPNGASLSLDAGREVTLGAGARAIVRAGDAAHLYLEEGQGSWVLPGGTSASLGPGLGAEALRLDDGIRLSADPTNGEPLRTRRGARTLRLGPGQSLAGDRAVRGWALREVRGRVGVRRGAVSERRALDPADRDRVRLADGDTVYTGPEASVALVRSAVVRLSAESALRVGEACDLLNGELGFDLPGPLRWAFGEHRSALLAGRGTLRREGEVLLLAADTGGATWRSGGCQLVLADGEALSVSGGVRGWQLEGFGLRLESAQGWSAELPEFVGLAYEPEGLGANLLCVGRRSWRVAAGARVELLADGTARFPDGTELHLPNGGAAQIHSGVVAAVSTPSAVIELEEGQTLLVHGPLTLDLDPAAVASTRTTLALGFARTVLLYPPRGSADFALALRSADRIDLPSGEVRVLARAGGLALRVGTRTLLLAPDAPPVQARVLDAPGTWDIAPEGLRTVRYPAGAGGVMHVGANGARWRPR